jgi:CPA2 family monovalent cation:H+ antiporter-2
MVVELPVIDIGVIAIVALIFGMILAKLRQPSSLGYIIGGIVLGPLGLHYLVPNEGIAPFFGEIGVLMLLFYLGLELSVKKFKETGAIAGLHAVIEMSFAFIAGYFIAKVFGLNDLEAIVLGAMLTCTSTIIVVKFLMERKIIDLPESRIAISVLILEDFFAILVLVFLTGLTQTGGAFNIAILNVLLYTIGVFFVVSTLSKHALNILHAFGQEDKITLYAVAVGIIVAYFGTLLGISPSLGAYFAGFALAETTYGDRIKRELGFFREFFILFFFVAFGSSLFAVDSTIMLPSIGNLPWLLALTACLLLAYILSKVIAYVGFGTVIGMSVDSAVLAGVTMIPIGEFSIIIANAAKPLLTPAAFESITFVVFLLIFLTTSASSTMYSDARGIARVFSRIYPRGMRNALAAAGAGSRTLGELIRDRVFETEAFSVLKRLVYNFVIAIAIVYLSEVIKEKFIPVPFLPAQISLGLIILPLLMWPMYKFVMELKFLTYFVGNAFLKKVFPNAAKRAPVIEHQMSDILTGIVITALGFAASAVMYFRVPLASMFFLIPLVYTLIAAMYLSKSFYSLFERYEHLESIIAGEENIIIGHGKLAQLTKEFDERADLLRRLHAERLRARDEIQSALLAGNVVEARGVLARFKRRETEAMVKAVGHEELAKKFTAYPMKVPTIRLKGAKPFELAPEEKEAKPLFPAVAAAPKPKPKKTPGKQLRVPLAKAKPLRKTPAALKAKRKPGIKKAGKAKAKAKRSGSLF